MWKVCTQAVKVVLEAHAKSEGATACNSYLLLYAG
jgi:hypothetical protein